jgi:hypothetical protein
MVKVRVSLSITENSETPTQFGSMRNDVIILFVYETKPSWFVLSTRSSTKSNYGFLIHECHGAKRVRVCFFVPHYFNNKVTPVCSAPKYIRAHI